MNSGGSEGQPRATGSAAAAKSALRSQLRAARRTRHRDPVDESTRTIRAMAACAGAGVVAAYASTADEPGTLDLIEQLRLAGVPVLLPVLHREPDWAWYTGPDGLSPGPLGIQQPAGRPLGADALALADWIWLPGLAGDPNGRRLGTGGGWYDRALAWANPSARFGLLLFDDEVIADVPTEGWDRSVQLLVTELRRLDCAAE